MMVRIKQILSFFTLLLCALTASAIEVTVSRSGQLYQQIGSPESEASLVVHGPVDASDLMFIAGNMPALVSLDLSDATIESCEIELNGRIRSFAANLIPPEIFGGTTIKNIRFPRNGKIEIADFAFVGGALSEINLGDNISAVGLGAFSACHALKKVGYTGSTFVSPYAFRDCNSLECVTLEGVDSIRQYVFAGCSGLSEVKGSATLTHIAESAFAECRALTGFEFGDRLQSVADGAFSASELLEADLSACSGLKQLGAWAFANCRSLQSVVLPNGLEYIGEGTFFDCPALTALTLPESMEELAAYSLKGTSAIEKLTLTPATRHIGDLAMSGMTALKSIDAKQASRVPDLGEDVWDGLAKSMIALHVTRALADEYRSTPQWQDFDIVIPSGDMDNIASDKVISATIDGSNLSVNSVTAIRELHIYDISARKIYSDISLDSDRVAIDISRIADRVLIVCAYTADGTRAAVKIVRN